MTLATTLLALAIVFPKSGARLPAIESCYMTGSVSRGETNLVIQSRDVAIYRTGGWVTMLDNLVAGTNTIEIIANGKTNLHSFVIASRENSSRVATTNKSTVASAKVYEKLSYASDVSRPHPLGKNPRDILIYLDPGHGGSDTGALSPHGFPEKDANLRVAREVEKALSARGITVAMTRTNDVAIALYDRAKEAHKKKADAFISIHHNAPPLHIDPRNTRYHATYVWNDLAEPLAMEINNEMAKVLDGDIASKGVLRANYAVTRSPEIPSCLIEIDFMTTPEEEEAVWCAPRRKAIGEAIASGIATWCGIE